MTRALLVATPGGHVDQLNELVPRIVGLGGDSERLWVTAQTPQTTSLLGDEQVHWVDRIGPREAGKVLARLPSAVALLRWFKADVVISTGAAMAVPYLAAASLLGIEAHYIESATRRDGPSLSGRILRWTPGVHLHQQSFECRRARWHCVGSVFDSFASGPGPDHRPASVVVVLGTEKYPFGRVLDQVRETFPRDTSILVQSGSTPGQPGMECRAWMPHSELQSAIEAADVVVTHSGVGSVLGSLRAGQHPIVLPRCAELGEHVDDHQSELAAVLRKRELATVVERSGHLGDVLAAALRRSTVRVSAAPINILEEFLSAPALAA